MILKILSKKQMTVLFAIIAGVCFLNILRLSQGIETLDAKPFYFKAEIFSLLEALGKDGRETYLKVVQADFIFIFFYSLLFISAYKVLFKKDFRIFVVVPLALCLFDVLETTFIRALLLSFPEQNHTMESLLVFLTPLKWLLALSSILMIVNGYLIKKIIKGFED